MQLRNVMTREVVTVAFEDTLQEAAEKMRANNIGSLPVCDGRNGLRVFGVITDRDIAVATVARGYSPQSTPVRELMSQGVVFCYEDEDVASAVRTMESHQIRRLLVLRRDRSLVGVVSLADLVPEDGDDDVAARALEGISQSLH